MFLPTTPEELHTLKWDALDIILVSGDSYIDSPYIGVALIGKILLNAGYRVGVIAQPDVNSPADITRLGEPRLFWGVTGGSVDSMVANYTASKKKRRSDDFTPGGENNRRPDRALLAYTNLIKRHFKSQRPIVLGGIEASLRRIAHYDYWDDRIRASTLIDSKADYLLYGMAERSILELATALSEGKDPSQIRGLCRASREVPEGYLVLPSLESVRQDKLAFIQMFHTFYQNNDPLNAVGLAQGHGNRYLVQNPPAFYPTQKEMDDIYNLDFERDLHPYYRQLGPVKALETIRFSIPTHRGCYGECNFCAIAVHEGRTVRWRSEESILEEAKKITRLPGFKGNILDVGGPTANMYGFECVKKTAQGSCQKNRCLYPEVCPVLKVDHSRQTRLLRRLRQLPGVRKVFVASGIRYDLILNDSEHGREYLQEVVDYHLSGQMKVAPEHSEDHVLRRMGKPGADKLTAFKRLFEDANRKSGKQQFLTYYLIAAYPGCGEEEMHALKRFVSRELNIQPEQVQIFTPTPSTYASLMYYTEMDPFTKRPIFVEKNLTRKERQKSILTGPGTKPLLKKRHE